MAVEVSVEDSAHETDNALSSLCSLKIKERERGQRNILINERKKEKNHWGFHSTYQGPQGLKTILLQLLSIDLNAACIQYGSWDQSCNGVELIMNNQLFNKLIFIWFFFFPVIYSSSDSLPSIIVMGFLSFPQKYSHIPPN